MMIVPSSICEIETEIWVSSDLLSGDIYPGENPNESLISVTQKRFVTL